MNSRDFYHKYIYAAILTEFGSSASWSLLDGVAAIESQIISNSQFVPTLLFKSLFKLTKSAIKLKISL